jgi:hypothetical protein
VKHWLQLGLAMWRVRSGRAERIAAPGQWKVWRDGDGVRVEILKRKDD